MNIYRARRIDDNLIVEGVYNISTEIGRAYPHEIFFESKWHEIDLTTLEVVKLDLNSTQIAWLKNVAYKDLITFQEGFNFLSDESQRIFFNSENYDSQVIDWAIELIDKLLFKIKRANELLKGI